MAARKISLNYRHITGYIQSDKSNEYTHFEAIPPPILARTLPL